VDRPDRNCLYTLLICASSSVLRTDQGGGVNFVTDGERLWLVRAF